MIHDPKTQGVTVNKPNPPRHQPDAGTQRPLLLKADIERPTKSDFFNSFSQKRTLQPTPIYVRYWG